jgi:hypothetical protein
MNNPMHNDFRIKLAAEDFIKADKVLENYYQKLLDKVKEDHYLFSFTNRELLEIIQKPDEWGDLDFQLAQKILKDRGEEITQADLNNLKEIRIKVLSKPAKSQTELVVLGYAIFGIGFIALFWGLKFRAIWFPFATLMGAIISQTKKTLPSGELLYSFNASDRKHGSIIFVLGLSLCIVITVLLLLGYIEPEKKFY